MSNFRISVIIPCFNAEETISRAIESAINQSVRPYEIIIIDDLSIDGSIRIINEFTQRTFHNVQIKLIRNDKNSGPSTSRNIGIRSAIGDWIAFLDADDYWHPQKLEIQMNVCQFHSSKFVGTLSSTEKKSIIFNKNISIKKLKPHHFLFKNYFQTPSVLVERSEFLKFNETMRYSEDFELWLRLIKTYGNAILIRETLTFLGKKPYLTKGLSSQLLRMEMGEISILLKEKNICLRFTAVCFSLLKFFKRIFEKAVNDLIHHTQ